MKTILIPAYGRDYTSKAKVLADFHADKDFIISDIASRWDGKSANKPDLKGFTIQFRYAGLRKQFILNT